MPVRVLATAAAALLLLATPTAALAVKPGPSEAITLSRPLPAHVNERTPLSGSVRIKHITPVGKFCFDINFAEPGLNETESFFIVIDGMSDHVIVHPPNTTTLDPNYNPLFVSLCTTDPANIAAIEDGKFTFVLGISQGSFDVAEIHTSSSPPGCIGCP
jgi:hypothetical protein